MVIFFFSILKLISKKLKEARSKLGASVEECAEELEDGESIPGEKWKPLRWSCGLIPCDGRYKISSRARLWSPHTRTVTSGFWFDDDRWAAADDDDDMDEEDAEDDDRLESTNAPVSPGKVAAAVVDSSAEVDDVEMMNDTSS